MILEINVELVIKIKKTLEKILYPAEFHQTSAEEIENLLNEIKKELYDEQL